MPALEPEKFPLLLQRIHETVDHLYTLGMTPETIRSQFDRLQKLTRSLVLTAPDGPVHEAAVAFFNRVKKLVVLYNKLTDSYMATRNHQFDSLKSGLETIMGALPEDEAKVARLCIRVGRVRTVLAAHA